ncbi:hypothetical protein [Geodermatophilus sp. URMC 65]
MTTAPTEAGLAFWREVFLAGGSTAIPRWTRDPRPGVARLETTLPGSLTVALRRRAIELGVPLRSLFLAAHARVLGALSGEADVVTGYVAGTGDHPVPCRLPGDAGSWRQLVRHAAEVEAGLRAHRGVPLDDLRRELDLTGPVSEAVVDPGGDGDLGGEAVLRVGVPGNGSRLALRYRTDVSTPPPPPGSPGTTVRRWRCSPPTPTPTPDGRACCPPRSCGSSSTGWPVGTASCPTARSTSCSRSRCACARTTWPPCTRTAS